MAERTNPSLRTLPSHLLHRVVQHLDEFTLFCTVPNICESLSTMAENNDRYKVEHRLFHTEPLCRLVAHYSFINTQKTCPPMGQSSGQYAKNEQGRTKRLLCIHYLLAHLKTAWQTLLNLDLGVNELDDESMFYLASALEQNQVIMPVYLVEWSSHLDRWFCSDAINLEYATEQIWAARYWISRPEFVQKPGHLEAVSSPSVYRSSMMIYRH